MPAGLLSGFLQHCGQDPVQITPCPVRAEDPHAPGSVRQRVCICAACYNEFFLRAGQCHIENSHLFRQRLHHGLFPDHFLQEYRLLCPPVKVDVIQSHAPFRVEDHTALRILHIKALSHSRGKYDWELQPLAFVDAHDAHSIRLFVHDPGFPVIHVIFPELSDISHKIKQSFIARPLKRRRLLHQHIHIRGPLRSGGHCRHRKPEARSLDDLREKFMDRGIGHLSPEMCHLVKKPLQLPAQCPVTPAVRLSAGLPGKRSACSHALISAVPAFLGVSAHSLIERQVRVRGPDLRHFRRSQVPERGCEHSRKGQVLPRIVQDLQVIQEHAHLISLKISLPAHRIGRDPFLGEHGGKVFRPAPDAAGQDHDIPVLYPAVPAGLPVNDRAVPDQLPDPPGDHAGLRPAGSLIPCIRFIQQKELRPVRKSCGARLPGQLREIRPHIQGGAVVILDAPKVFSHDLAEQIIHTVQDLRPAPEIFVQVDPLHYIVFQAVCVVLFHKELRSGKTEAVNTLLYISYHKDIVSAL